MKLNATMNEQTEFKPSDITIYHYGYQEELYTDGINMNRYLKLYNKHLDDNPYDGYMLYQLGKLYYSQRDLREALDALESCLEVNEENRFITL